MGNRRLWRYVLLLLFLAPLSAQPIARGPQFAGDAKCQLCHPDIWASFTRNPHFKTIVTREPVKETFGCEGCHGPGAPHIEANGDKTKINRIAGRSTTAVLEACLKCHAKDFSRANVRHSEHTENDVACTDCHSVHRSPTPRFLLIRQEKDLCYTCHVAVRAQFDMPYRHRVNEGAMVCSDCHNPHGSFNPAWREGIRPRMVADSFGNDEACFKCHADKRGPFVYEHPPVRIEGCEKCHSPHGSVNPRLLARPAVFTMCLECHNGIAGFSKTGFGDPAPAMPFHRLDQPRFQNCVTCHVRIHGSNVNYFFER